MALVPAELCHVPAVCWSQGKGHCLSRASMAATSGNLQPAQKSDRFGALGWYLLCFKAPPELCLGRAALRAGRCLWLRDRALQSCHCLWQCLWQCLQGGWCQAGMIPAGAAFRAAGFGAELLVSGGLEHMVNAASASGDGGREIHEGCSCDSPALLPVGFSCQSQCRRSSGDNVAVVVLLSIPSVQEMWCKWGFSAATVRLG